jgi:adenylate cyclase
VDENTPTAIEQFQLRSHVLPSGAGANGISEDGSLTSISQPYLPTDVVSGCDYRRVIKQNLTVLSVDIRGFTSLAETIDPEECLSLLNEYFEFAVELVFKNGGEVDKFQGDGFMAIFRQTSEDTHERQAVQCALRLRDMARSLNLPEVSGVRIPLGMGVNTGLAAIGNVGSKARSDYTVIGDVVNVAHYLQRISGPDQIILSGITRRRVGADVECTSLGYVRVKRRISRVEAFLID